MFTNADTANVNSFYNVPREPCAITWNIYLCAFMKLTLCNEIKPSIL